MTTTREELARILEIVARDGLDGPRDLDVALDAIEATIEGEVKALREALQGVMLYLPIGFAATGRYGGADDRNAKLQTARENAVRALAQTERWSGE